MSEATSEGGSKRGSTVAVTGAAGRLGRAVLELLVADPAVSRVVALDRVRPAMADPKVDFREADVRDPEIARHLAGCDALVHLAFVVERGSRDEKAVNEINVGGTANVCEAAAAEGVPQIAYVSSIAAYGIHPENASVRLTEDAPTRGNPEFYYPRTKAEVEHWLDDFEKRHPEVRVARLRPSLFASTGSEFGMRPPRGPFFPYPSRNRAPLHLTHTNDVARAVVLTVERGAHGAFNVATEEPLSLPELARATGRRAFPIPSFVVGLYAWLYRLGIGDIDPTWLEYGSRRPLLVSSEKIRHELGWKPRYASTAEVARAVWGRPNARASHAARAFLGTLARLTRLFGSLPASEAQRAEGRGLDGSTNLVLTGERPSEWCFHLRDGALGVRAGSDPNARTTLTLSDRSFRDMLAGRLDWTTAQMTGKIRMRGDGELLFLLGVLVEQFRGLRERPGLRGAPARRFARWVLRPEREASGAFDAPDPRSPR